MHTLKARRMVAAGIVAAALAVASLGSAGVSASAINDDELGSYTVQPVAAVPFTTAYTVNAVPFMSASYGAVNSVPFVTAGAGQVDNSLDRGN